MVIQSYLTPSNLDTFKSLLLPEAFKAKFHVVKHFDPVYKANKIQDGKIISKCCKFKGG